MPPASIQDEQPPDETHLINPPEKVCPTCGDEIVRVPGKKGRLPKYHEECRPAKGTSTSSGARTVRVSAKDRLVAEQVEAAIEQIDSKLTKAVLLLSLADPYDAFVLRVNQPELLENLRPALMRFTWLREQASNASAGASLVGLAITIATIILPIAAHHKLIPSKRVSQIILAIPMIMKRMQDNMTGDEDITSTLMARVREQQQKANEARMRAQAHSESVNASFTR